MRWGKFAKFAQKNVGEGTFEDTLGSKLELRWGKGAELAPKKVAEGIFEAQVQQTSAKGSHLEADFGPKLAPRGGQEGEVMAKMAASVGQERAKRAKRRLGKRSWNEKLDFETGRFHLKNVYLLDVGSAKWRQVGIEIGKMRLRFRKLRRGWGREGKIEARGRKKLQGLRKEEAG
mgnify:CR=1 FL=1